MHRLGIIDRFDKYLDGNIPIRDSLRSKMEELVGMSTRDDASFSSSMNESDTREYLFLNLKATLASQLDHNQTLALQANTVRSMQQFSTNEDIQELGCKLLASVYGKSDRLAVNGIDEVIKCISSPNVGLISAAASACRNFCVMQISPDLDSYEMQRLVRNITFIE